MIMPIDFVAIHHVDLDSKQPIIDGYMVTGIKLILLANQEPATDRGVWVFEDGFKLKMALGVRVFVQAQLGTVYSKTYWKINPDGQWVQSEFLDEPLEIDEYPTYEYKVVSNIGANSGAADLESKLNKLGVEKWKYVDTPYMHVRAGRISTVIIMKRRKNG